jgi:hypothetical protein
MGDASRMMGTREEQHECSGKDQEPKAISLEYRHHPKSNNGAVHSGDMEDMISEVLLPRGCMQGWKAGLWLALWALRNLEGFGKRVKIH